jgi:SM-20-related protein
MSLALNPDLDVTALADAYRAKERIQIRDFLTEDSAQALQRELESLPWGLVYNEGTGVVQVGPEQVAQLGSREAAEIMAGIQERARSSYQFFYAYFPILNAYFSPEAPRLGVFDFYEFINTEPVLDVIREVTGLADIRWADGQATWFKPGHFLKAHTDEEKSEGRLAAYVMNLTPQWERDWGGSLQFFDRNDDVEQAYKPAFNALNLFTVPQLHSVSMVATYVTERRLAITGWFRSDSPPGPIGALDR